MSEQSQEQPKSPELFTLAIELSRLVDGIIMAVNDRISLIKAVTGDGGRMPDVMIGSVRVPMSNMPSSVSESLLLAAIDDAERRVFSGWELTQIPVAKALELIAKIRQEKKVEESAADAEEKAAFDITKGEHKDGKQ